MSDRNLIQLEARGHWHYWNFGSMMPICGAGTESKDYPKTPTSFRKSMHATAQDAGRRRRICPECLLLAGQP